MVNDPSIADVVDIADVRVSEGYVIRGHDLRGHVTDPEAFRSTHQQDPAVEAVIALSEQRFDDAMQVLDELLTESPDSLRYQALRADVLRDQGNLDAAEAVYTDLIARANSDAVRGAMLRQHRAKVWFLQGRLAEAEAEFAEVLAAREATGVSDDQVASTRQSLERVRSAMAQQQEAA